MLRDDILSRYILSRPHFFAVRQVTIRLKLASSTPTRTFRPRWTSTPFGCPHLPWERSSNGSRNHAAPSMGSGSGCDARTPPSGDSRHAGHHRRVRESAGRRADPELPCGVLSDHPRLPSVAADAAGSFANHGPGV